MVFANNNKVDKILNQDITPPTLIDRNNYELSIRESRQKENVENFPSKSFCWKIFFSLLIKV